MSASAFAFGLRGYIAVRWGGTRRLPPTERRAYLAERPDLRDAIRRRGEERRALLRRRPDVTSWADLFRRARHAEETTV